MRSQLLLYLLNLATTGELDGVIPSDQKLSKTSTRSHMQETGTSLRRTRQQIPSSAPLVKLHTTKMHGGVSILQISDPESGRMAQSHQARPSLERLKLYQDAHGAMEFATSSTGWHHGNIPT